MFDRMAAPVHTPMLNSKHNNLRFLVIFR
uniref:Uncharacterized protein n=1 Tax=Arundo donax TaxID=35708 RepID=A0A0A9G4S5_ARUDO